MSKYFGKVQDKGCNGVFVGNDRVRVGFWYRMNPKCLPYTCHRYTDGKINFRVWRFSFCRNSRTP